MTATTKVRGKKPQDSSLNILCKGIWLAVFKGPQNTSSRCVGAEWRSRSAGENHFLVSTASRGFSQMNGSYRLTKSQPKHICPKVTRWYVWGLDARGIPQCHLQPFPSSRGCQMLENPALPEDRSIISGCFWLPTHYIKIYVST